MAIALRLKPFSREAFFLKRRESLDSDRSTLMTTVRSSSAYSAATPAFSNTAIAEVLMLASSGNALQKFTTLMSPTEVPFRMGKKDTTASSSVR